MAAEPTTGKNASNQAELGNQLAKRTEQTGAVEKKTGYASIESMMEKYSHEIIEALPRHLIGDQFLRLILHEFRKTPQLIRCDPATILGAVMTCARLGLEPGQQLGLIYLIPYQRSIKDPNTGAWSKVLEAQVQLGYRGLIALAYRTGRIISITPRDIRENDEFQWTCGSHESIDHRPVKWQDRGKILGYYIVINMTDGSSVVSKPWSVADIEAHRKKFAQTKDGAMTPAWKNSYDTMAAKTIFKDMIRWLPLATELATLAEADENTIRYKGSSDDHDLIDALAYSDVTDAEIIVEAEVVDTATGEVMSGGTHG